jgi:hypothetical protein
MNTQAFAQRIPIPPSIQQRIWEVTSQVPLQRVKEVRQRAIAVWVVARFLSRFGYDVERSSAWHSVDLAYKVERSSAWNPALQALTDWADLEVFEGDRFLGMVECIPMASDAETLEIPEQAVMSDRIAYIAVETNAEYTWGAVVGFTPALRVKFSQPQVPRENLLGIEQLLDLLEMAEPLMDESLFSELKPYLDSYGNLYEEQRLAIIAQLERALLLQTKERRQVDSAARELEALMAQSTPEQQREERAIREREQSQSSDRAELRSIVQRIFQSLRENLD